MRSKFAHKSKGSKLSQQLQSSFQYNNEHNNSQIDLFDIEVGNTDKNHNKIQNAYQNVSDQQDEDLERMQQQLDQQLSRNQYCISAFQKNPSQLFKLKLKDRHIQIQHKPRSSLQIEDKILRNPKTKKSNIKIYKIKSKSQLSKSNLSNQSSLPDQNGIPAQLSFISYHDELIRVFKNGIPEDGSGNQLKFIYSNYLMPPQGASSYEKQSSIKSSISNGYDSAVGSNSNKIKRASSYEGNEHSLSIQKYLMSNNSLNSYLKSENNLKSSILFKSRSNNSSNSLINQQSRQSQLSQTPSQDYDDQFTHRQKQSLKNAFRYIVRLIFKEANKYVKKIQEIVKKVKQNIEFEQNLSENSKNIGRINRGKGTSGMLRHSQQISYLYLFESAQLISGERYFKQHLSKLSMSQQMVTLLYMQWFLQYKYLRYINKSNNENKGKRKQMKKQLYLRYKNHIMLKYIQDEIDQIKRNIKPVD